MCQQFLSAFGVKCTRCQLRARLRCANQLTFLCVRQDPLLSALWVVAHELIVSRFDKLEGVALAPVVDRKNARVCLVVKLVSENGNQAFEVHEKAELPRGAHRKKCADLMLARMRTRSRRRIRKSSFCYGPAPNPVSGPIGGWLACNFFPSRASFGPVRTSVQQARHLMWFLPP